MDAAISISPDDAADLQASAGRFLRKSIRSLLGQSEALIPDSQFPDAKAVHDIRVNMKRGRAVLKLLRASPRSRFYRRENNALRDISSLFSHSRESEVLKKTLTTLARQHPDIFTSAIRNMIQGEAKNIFSHKLTHNEEENITASARQLLRCAWYRIGFVTLTTVSRETLLDGLWISFYRAEDAFNNAQITGAPAEIHEFRKRSKDLLYQCRFFSDYNPGHFEQIYCSLAEICTLLGKCNDLAVAGNIAAACTELSDDKEMRIAIGIIEEERGKLMKRITPKASAIFSMFYSGN